MVCEKLWLTFQPQHGVRYGVTIRYSAMAAQAHSEQDVKRDIISMLEALQKDARIFANIYLDSMNRKQIRKTCRVPAIPKWKARLNAWISRMGQRNGEARYRAIPTPGTDQTSTKIKQQRPPKQGVFFRLGVHLGVQTKTKHNKPLYIQC